MQSIDSSKLDLGGVCLRCNKLNSSRTWCKSCDPKLLTKNCNRLVIGEKLGEGGFGEVYIAKWLDGHRKFQFTEQKRSPSCFVAVKRLKGTNIQEISDKFFSEIHPEAIYSSRLLELGVSKNSSID
ncbi:19246_t:CDS:2, partial [Gigaspora rosea]